MKRLFHFMGQWKRAFEDGYDGRPLPHPVREKLFGCEVDWSTRCLILPSGARLTQQFLMDTEIAEVSQWSRLRQCTRV
jgi:hypothetical protein